MQLCCDKDVGTEVKDSIRPSLHFLEHVTCGVLVVTSMGHIVYSNRLIEEMLGYQRGELEGLPIDSIIPVIEAGNADGEDPIWLLGKGMQLPATRKNGHQLTVEVSVNFIPRNEQPTYLCCITDITPHCRLQQSLEQHLSKLKLSNTQLRMFGTTITRELQEPLEEVRRLAQSLEANYSEQFKEPRLSYLRRLGEQSVKLNNHVHALIGFGKLANTSMTQTPSCLREVLELSVTYLAVLIEEQCVTLQVADHMPRVLIDPILMAEVFTQLVYNAIEYNSSRRKQIHVYFDDITDCYVVSDNGIGIAKEYHDSVFDPFVRLNPDKSAGKGMGLTIVKKIISRHGGEVWIESEIGQGTAVHFRLPIPVKQH